MKNTPWSNQCTSYKPAPELPSHLPTFIDEGFEGLSMHKRWDPFFHTKWNFLQQDPDFPQLVQSVCEEQDHTCAYCGFHAKSHMQIMPIDGDFFRATSWRVACPLCWQSIYLQANPDNFIGFIDQEQQVIVQTFLLMFCHIINHTQYQDEVLSVHRAYAKQCWKDDAGEYITVGAFLETWMRWQAPKEEKDALLQTIRVIPHLQTYVECVLDWSDEVERELKALEYRPAGGVPFNS